jgi:hypothetical protein
MPKHHTKKTQITYPQITPMTQIFGNSRTPIVAIETVRETNARNLRISSPHFVPALRSLNPTPDPKRIEPNHQSADYADFAD